MSLANDSDGCMTNIRFECENAIAHQTVTVKSSTMYAQLLTLKFQEFCMTNAMS